MSPELVLRAALGLLPVLCFLAALRAFDSYKLVHLKPTLGLIGIGGLAAVGSYWIGAAVLAQVDLGFTVAMRLPMVFSFGVARGFGDKDVDGRTEWLASLKIM